MISSAWSERAWSSRVSAEVRSVRGAIPPVSRAWVSVTVRVALATVSLLILAWAYARGEANYLAPTEYTGFIWASLWGWVVFHEAVATYTLAGAAMIIAGCLVAARKRDVETVEAAF